VSTKLGPYGVYWCHFSTTTSLLCFLWHLTSCSNCTRALLGNAGPVPCGTHRLPKACPTVHIILAALAICLHWGMVRWTMPLTAHACGLQRHCKRATQLTTLRNHDWGCQPSFPMFLWHPHAGRILLANSTVWNGMAVYPRLRMYSIVLI
jgi:hypothetical protein